ncbi:MAG: MmcQ/YjbR family DNA-binding protein [Gammaproteobacteria bacterium]|nr:MmcQ/YjbR family DNA-binding protein [Gammaproteobacteria bacterium]
MTSAPQRKAKRPATRAGDADLTALVKEFRQDRHVTYGGKGFGSTALKVKGRIFAMLSSKGRFVVKLSGERVDELVQSGKGEYFEPARGRLMKEWLVVKLPESAWPRLAREAHAFVRRGAV